MESLNNALASQLDETHRKWEAWHRDDDDAFAQRDWQPSTGTSSAGNPDRPRPIKPVVCGSPMVKGSTVNRLEVSILRTVASKPLRHSSVATKAAARRKRHLGKCR